MNETHISDFVRSEARSEMGDTAPLRPIVWSELTAQLAAMRDLRQSLSGSAHLFAGASTSLAGTGTGGHSCSAFTDFAEVREELSHELFEVNENTTGINPNALADGKGPGPNTSVEHNGVNPGDRELK